MKLLKETPVDKDDENLKGAVDMAVGVQAPPGRNSHQLDIRYRDGKTYVSVVEHKEGAEPSAYEHFMLSGDYDRERLLHQWEEGHLPKVAEETETKH